MVTGTILYNVYSEGGSAKIHDRSKNKIMWTQADGSEYRQFLLALCKENEYRMPSIYEASKGVLTYGHIYKTAEEKKYFKNSQKYYLIVQSFSDVIVISRILLGLDRVNVPRQYSRVASLFKDSTNNNAVADGLINAFKYFFNDYTGRVKLREYANDEIKYRNPSTKRFIKMSGRVFSTRMRHIPLRKAIYADIHHLKTMDYDIDDGAMCVPSFLKNVLGISFNDLMTKYDIKKDDTVNGSQLTRIVNDSGYKCRLYTIEKEEISKPNQEYDAQMSFLIHSGHLYYMGKGKDIQPKTEKIFIEDVKELLNDDKFKNLHFYTSGEIICDGVRYKNTNRFNKLVEYTGFTSTYLPINTEFYEKCGIRPSKYCNETLKNKKNELINYTNGFDINKCYYNIMTDPTAVFGVQTGHEDTVKFDRKKDKVKDYGFYYCEFRTPRTEIEEALYPSNWIYGKIINTHLYKRVKILYAHVPCSYKFGALPEGEEEYKNELRKMKERNKKKKNKEDVGKLVEAHEAHMKELPLLYSHFSGYLAHRETHGEMTIITDDLEELFLLNNRYGGTYMELPDELTLLCRESSRGYGYSLWTKDQKYKVTGDRVYIDDGIYIDHGIDGNDQNNYYYEVAELNTPLTLHIPLDGVVKRSGIYAYLSIVSLCKHRLHTVYNECQKINMGRIIKINTDSIAFEKRITEHDLKKINSALKPSNISVKIEEHASMFHACPHPSTLTGDTTEINEYGRDDVKMLIDSGKSFSLEGPAGYGKSYIIKEVICKELEKRNIKCVVTSTTIESSKEYASTIQGLIMRRNMNSQRIAEYLGDDKKIKYIIVDEIGQATSSVFNRLNQLKKYIGNRLKLIFVGDPSQCPSVDSGVLNWMKTRAYSNLIDNNHVRLNYHEYSRYTPEYDAFLKPILTLSKEEVFKYVKENLKIKYVGEEDENEIKLTYRHKIGKTLGDYMTIHGAQGKTLTKNVSVYDLEGMEYSKNWREILYTALSRVVGFENITLFIQKDLKI